MAVTDQKEARPFEKTSPLDASFLNQLTLPFLNESEIGYSLDEMNLVEIPFCSLSDNRGGRTNRPAHLLKENRISKNGDQWLRNPHRIPSAEAERILIALLWMHSAHNGFETNTLNFKLNTFIKNYLYPHTKHKISSVVKHRVLKELFLMSCTNITYLNWWDAELKQKVAVDFSIFSELRDTTKRAPGVASVFEAILHDLSEFKRPQPAGQARNTNYPITLQVTWAPALFKSIVSNYTKPVDPRFVIIQKNPIDIRLYRYLDRQLTTKPVQKIRCEALRYKLNMQGAQLEKTVKTMSRYVSSKVEVSIKRLRAQGFMVDLHVDKSRDDYMLVFMKESALGLSQEPERKSEEILVAKFYELKNGSSKGVHATNNELKLAREWIKQGGYDLAEQVVTHLVQKLSKEEKISVYTMTYFRNRYNDAVSKLNDQASDKNVPPPPPMPSDDEQDLDEVFPDFEDLRLDFIKKFGQDRFDDVEEQAMVSLRQEMGGFSPKLPKLLEFKMRNLMKAIYATSQSNT